MLIGIVAGFIIVISVMSIWSHDYENYKSKYSKTKLGMTRVEIFNIYGSPLYIKSEFSDYEIWGYVPAGILQEHITMFFSRTYNILTIYSWKDLYSRSMSDSLLNNYIINFQRIIQMAIDFEELQPYLLLTNEEQEVLYIIGDALPDNLELRKFGKPVEISPYYVNISDCIRFHTINIEDKKARVVFDYVRHGIKCELSFELSQSGWTIISSELSAKTH